MKFHPIENISECRSFLMVMQKLMLCTKNKTSTHKRIDLFTLSDTPYLIKYLGVVFLIQAQDDVSDIYV